MPTKRKAKKRIKNNKRIAEAEKRLAHAHARARRKLENRLAWHTSEAASERGKWGNAVRWHGAKRADSAHNRSKRP